MLAFFDLLYDFFLDILNSFYDATISFGDGSNRATSLGAIIFASIVIGFVASIFWKGAKSQ